MVGGSACPDIHGADMVEMAGKDWGAGRRKSGQAGSMVQGRKGKDLGGSSAHPKLDSS